MDHRRVLFHVTGFFGHPKYLDKMQFLAFVRDVDVSGGFIRLLSVQDRPQIRGGIQSRPVGLADDAGRQFLGIPLLGNIHHQSALAFVGKPFLLQILDQSRDVLLGVALSLPQIKGHPQIAVVLPKVSQGHVHDVTPDSTKRPIAVLQPESGLLGSCLKAFVLLGLGAGGGIDVLQLSDGKRRLCGIRSPVILIKIGQIRLSVPQLLDNEPHLQAPVPQMHVPNHVIAQKTPHALNALPDDGGAQMAHMEGFCHIGSAVVHDNRLALAAFLKAVLWLLLHGI